MHQFGIIKKCLGTVHNLLCNKSVNKTLCDKGKTPGRCSIRDVSPVNTVTLAFLKALRLPQNNLSRSAQLRRMLEEQFLASRYASARTYLLTKQSVIYVLYSGIPQYFMHAFVLESADSFYKFSLPL